MSEDVLLAQDAALAQNRRTLRSVDGKFQRRYALVLLMLLYITSFILFTSFWYHSQLVLNTITSAGVSKHDSLYLLIQRQMFDVLMVVGAVVVLFSVGILILASVLSKRIVGPIFAIKRSFEQLARGDLQSARMQLRTADEFQGVATLVNQTIDEIAKRRGQGN